MNKRYSISIDISDLGEAQFFDRPYFLNWDTLEAEGDNVSELIESAELFTLGDDGETGPWCMLTDISDVTRERLIHRIYMEVESLDEKRSAV